jgi:LPS-assembly protein
VLKISYPLIKKNAEYAQVLEPIIMMVASPNGSNPDKIPNVDSSVFDFDDVNLFSPNRYMGYDKVESGSRINYGVQWTLYQTDKKRSIQALLGQSIRLREKDELDDAMGYDGHFSSYVGRLQLNYDYLTLAYRFRMAQESFEAQKNDISVEAGSSPLRIGLNYLFQDSFRFGDVYSTAKKEVSVYVRSRLTKNWSLEGRYRYNLLKSDRGPLETYGILRYDNECAAVEFEASKSYTHDRNYKGDTSITMRFYLKTLGGFGQ